MLLATQIGCPPSLISGFGASTVGFGATQAFSAPLAALQKELLKLSKAAQNPAIDPNEYSGETTNGLPSDRTVAAVASAMALIGPKLPTIARGALAIALGVGATTDRAKKAVLDYADALRKAVIAATIVAPHYVKPGETATEDKSIFATTGPWYKTWWGIGAMVIGGLGVISLISSSRRE